VQQAMALAKGRALAIKAQTATILKHPRFQTIALGGSSGLVIVGPTCGFIGCGAGVAIGTVVGVIPAVFTLGLSIPFGAVVGGGVGTCVGLAVGGSSGLIVGGAAGHLGHMYRAEIKDGFLYIKTKSGERTIDLQTLIVNSVATTKSKVLDITVLSRAKAADVQEQVKGQAIKLGKKAHSIAAHPKFQVTAASAAGGAMVAGAGGGAAGLVTGGAIGAAVGVLPALFTLGLSIPIGAAIGGSAGLFVGTAAGGTAGAVAGGTTGYHVHSHSNEIKSGANGAWMKAHAYVGMVKTSLVGAVSGAR